MSIKLQVPLFHSPFPEIVHLASTTQEMRITRDSLLEEVNIHWLSYDNIQAGNSTTSHLPVRNIRNSTPGLVALVDTEDLPRVQKFPWRMIRSGHVVSTAGRVTRYLHKLIFDGPSTHSNGNRLDNRKENLIPTRKRGIKRAKSSFPRTDSKRPPSES